MAHNIIDKLKKLIQHKESAEAIGNRAEAEAFAGRIQEWLTKHKLSMSDLEAKQEEEKGVSSGLAVDPRRFGMKDKDAMIPWLLTLARAVAATNDCEVLVQMNVKDASAKEYKKTGKIFTETHSNRFIFVGVEADRLAAEEFYVYMAKLVWELAGKAGDSVKEELREAILEKLGKCAPGHLSAKLHEFRHAFCKGFVSEVARRLYEAREKEKAAAKNTEMGLMVIDRRAVMVKDWMSKNTGKASTAKIYGAGQESALGYALGAQQGRKVALTSKTVEVK